MSEFSDATARGTRAAQPASGPFVGALYFVTDELVTERWSGSAWQSFSGSGTAAITQLTGDVTAGPGSGSQAATIANNAVTTAKILDANVTRAKLSNGAAVSVIGRSANSSGVPADIAASANGLFLSRLSSTLAFRNVPSIGRPAAWNPPVNSDFSWVNQGSSTIVDNTENVVLKADGTGAAANVVARVKTAPTVPYTITAYIQPLVWSKPFQSYGLIFRQSSDGKLAIFDILMTDLGLTTPMIRSTKFTNPTTFSADYTTSRLPFCPNWLRIADDNTNRICSVSGDGENWVVFHSVGRTDFLTADQVGFGLSTENSVAPEFDANLTLWNWTQA